jgi:hypothetical protein
MVVNRRIIMNIFKCGRWSSIGFFFLMVFFTISYSSGSEKNIKGTITIIGNYGYIERYDTAWNLLTKGKVSGLVGGAFIHDADISPDGRVLFLAVSKKDTPLIIVNTNDMSINEEHKITFPSPGYYAYLPMSVIAASSRYLYMADESYTALAKPFFNIMIDVDEGSSTPIVKQLFLGKEDVKMAPMRDTMITRGWENLYKVEVHTSRIIDSISFPIEYGEKELSTFDVDWVNKRIMLYKVKSNHEQLITRISLNMVNKEISKLKDERVGINNRIRKISLQLNGTRFLIEDEKDNLYIVDSGTYKILDKVGHEVTSNIKGYGLTSCLSPDGSQLIYFKNDIVKNEKKEEKEISGLCAIRLKTEKNIKPIEYPEKVVTVLFTEEFQER